MRQQNLEELPLHSSKGKRRQYGWNGRDNHGPKGTPLRRWLQSRVGEAWDKIWSAAKKKFSRVELELIDYYVTKNFIYFDEYRNAVDAEGHWIHYFYLDHKKLLRKAPKIRFGQRSTPPAEYIQLDDSLYGVWNGVWYKLALEKIPLPTYVLRGLYPYENKKNCIYHRKVNITDCVFDTWTLEYINDPKNSPYRNGQYCVGYKAVGHKVAKQIKAALEVER